MFSLGLDPWGTGLRDTFILLPQAVPGKSLKLNVFGKVQPRGPQHFGIQICLTRSGTLYY